MDDHEPQREDERTDGSCGPEDPTQRACALVVAGRSTHEDPGMVEATQDRECPEQQREQGHEGHEDAEADAARQVVSLRAEPQARERDRTPAEQAAERDPREQQAG